ncbi:MAG: hypothetical protein JXB05_06145 [Myxococcaceae bacterium]|nr:hypothetical protein [Myxococcaceae bacterium]
MEPGRPGEREEQEELTVAQRRMSSTPGDWLVLRAFSNDSAEPKLETGDHTRVMQDNAASQKEGRPARD